MRRLSILTTTMLIACGLLSNQAHAAGCSPETTVCLGQPCDGADVGKTVRDHDDVNIIACLRATSGNAPYVWKSMTGRTNACPTGQLVSGYRNGEAICSQMQCRTVTEKGTPPTYVSTVSCNDDEFVLNGGGYTHYTECGYQGFLHATIPVLNKNGWSVDAWGADTPWGKHASDDVCTTVVATCCKWVPTSYAQ